MHLPGLFQILVLALIALVLFGRGRIGDFMGDVGRRVKSFRQAFTDEEEATRLPGAQTTAEATASADHTSK